MKTWTVNKVKRSRAYRHVVCCPSGRWGQRERPLRKNSHEVRWKSWVVRKENRQTDRRRGKGLSWKPIIMPSRWREDVCLHVWYQVVCNLPVSMSDEQKKLDVMVQFLLGKPLCFWTDLFYPPFLLCVFRANGNMFLFKQLIVSCRVSLSRWAVQSCSAASVNNCFDLHPWSCLPVSPCWVSDGLLLSLGNDAFLLGYWGWIKMDLRLICHFIEFLCVVEWVSFGIFYVLYSVFSFFHSFNFFFQF